MLSREERIQRRYDRVIREWGLAPCDEPPRVAPPSKPAKKRRYQAVAEKKYRRKIDDAAFAAMVSAGNTPKQIAIDLGVSRQAVSQRAMALGLSERLRENKPEPKRKAIKRKDRYGLPWDIVGPLIQRGVTKAFHAQRKNAAVRGIGWELSFAQWWALWEADYDRRGRSKGCLVMCRTGDKGPYAVGNVRIASIKENAQERSLEQMTKKGRKMPIRRYAPLPPGSALNRHGVFHEYSEDGETA